jgi:hypothetical protein
MARGLHGGGTYLWDTGRPTNMGGIGESRFAFWDNGTKPVFIDACSFSLVCSFTSANHNVLEIISPLLQRASIKCWHATFSRALISEFE